MKAKIIKNTGFVLLAILVIIQFIHPAKNLGESLGDNDIRKITDVPDPVMNVLKTSCFDCHSNHTEYPWYHAIQPVGFWLDDHVNEGKRELNFSEFAGYKLKRQLKKLEKIAKEVEEKEMPLSSYLLIHKDSELSPEQANLLMDWAKKSLADLKESSANIHRGDSAIIEESHEDHEANEAH